MYKFLPAVAFLFVLFFSLSCQRIKSPVEPLVHDLVRAHVKLELEDAPIFENMTATQQGEQPTVWHIDYDPAIKCAVEFEYRWQDANDRFIDVELVISKTGDEAVEYVMNMRESASIPMDIYEPQDVPTLAGDISFGRGRSFVRDNFIIRIRADDETSEQMPAIAEQVDIALQKCPGAISAEKWQPKIKKFDVAENPVCHGCTTRFLLDVDNAHDKLYYHWRFDPAIAEHGGIETGEGDDFYYYAGTWSAHDKVTLIVVNDYGFYDTAEVDIEIMQ